MDYYIVIPAHNEEAFIKLTLDSIVKQTLLPKKVVVVNDNSTDNTETIIDSFVAEYNFIQKLNAVSTSEHMPGSKVVNAFNKGLAILDEHYDFIVKLDSDLILPLDYFEKIAVIFSKSEKIGLAGGFVYEENEKKEWMLNHPMNKDHVRGAFKAYRKPCFKAIGGLKSAMGWDTVDELLTRFHGYEIHTDDSLKVKHLRPTGKNYNKKAKFLQGKAMYTLRYGFFITLIASAKMAWKQRKLQTLIDNLRGYFSAKKEKTPFLVSQEEGAFIRSYRWKGILGKLF
ncbi:glycosyltransferase family A protein [Galbibacter sp. EGI 63066]|uniref:glycosyltransferase family 2 protein n=1 Tax=Galbibacter sp. EGI 63066 TaxID=2993559 RepID=UPI0022493354|nr:glycosyltransferase family A protein [Galbibacter sp. EGI 63066]MCX2681142.1 glycosyltransferase family A protein [Galbibacter sp. EGI 63066]